MQYLGCLDAVIRSTVAVGGWLDHTPFQVFCLFGLLTLSTSMALQFVGYNSKQERHPLTATLGREGQIIARIEHRAYEGWILALLAPLCLLVLARILIIFSCVLCTNVYSTCHPSWFRMFCFVDSRRR